MNSSWFSTTHDALLQQLPSIWRCKAVLNRACLSPGRRDYPGQGHRNLWFLRITAAVKPEKLQESLTDMEKEHCGWEHLSLCLSYMMCWAPDSTSRLPLRCRRDDGREGQSHQPKQERARAWGQLYKTETSTRSQSWRTGGLLPMCEWWMKGFKTSKC